MSEAEVTEVARGERVADDRAGGRRAHKAKTAQKSDQAFRTISEVAVELDLPQHVLRFWETKFSQISPLKRGGGRRYYRPEDVELLRGIKTLLHFDGYTIKGVQKLLSQGGVKNLLADKKGSPDHNGGASLGPGNSVSKKPDLTASHAPTGGQTALQTGQDDLAGLAVLLSELEEISNLLKKSVS